jgi:hypothetical protein
MILKFVLIIIAFFTIMMHAQIKDTVYVDTTKAGIVDTVSADTTGLLSTQKTIAKRDTTTPLYQRPLVPTSTFIDRREIDFLDYRYTGDMFQHIGLSFLRNYGFVGYPNELILFGTDHVGFLENGIYLNNRLSGYYNLNLMPSEMIDSIEVISAPRGFLFNPGGNPVSINFIKRDIYSVRPYTRIKYFEGPNGEGFIDAIFNSIIFRDLIFTINISNRKADSSYVNSAFSIWQGEAHLKYLMSNKVSLTASYGYNDYDTGLNGGVNVDSISKVTSDIGAILYDNLRAPVYFTQRRMNILQHNLGLRLFANPIVNSFSDLSFYYRFDKTEITNPADQIIFPQSESNKNKTIGALLKQEVSFEFAELKVIAQFERTNTRLSAGWKQENNLNYLTLIPSITLNLIDTSIVPSFFYKIQNISYGVSKVYNGLGFDLSLKLMDYLDLYGGYSIYKSADLTDNVNTVELSAKFNFDYIKFGVDFINRNESYQYNGPVVLSGSNPYNIDLGAALIGGNFSLRFWKILLETTGNYDFSKHKSTYDLGETVASPQVKLTGGLYLDGKFFDDNLYLKTGFTVNYNSKQRIFISGNEIDLADQFATIDYTLVGEIKKVAYAYFTWENLADETYYIVPYYPMFRRGIRFGVAWELFN